MMSEECLCIYNFSLHSKRKRFRLVLEQRKTEEGDIGSGCSRNETRAKK